MDAANQKPKSHHTFKTINSVPSAFTVVPTNTKHVVIITRHFAKCASLSQTTRSVIPKVAHCEEKYDMKLINCLELFRGFVSNSNI